MITVLHKMYDKIDGNFIKEKNCNVKNGVFSKIHPL